MPTCDLGAMKADIAFLVDTSVDQSYVNWVCTVSTPFVNKTTSVQESVIL